MAVAETEWTVRRILEWTTAHLKQHGSESPRLEAEVLLAHARDCPRIRLYTDFSVVLTEQVRARMRDLVKRRAAHTPVAYLVGYREFFSLQFAVTPDVLIPRPETETLVLTALDWLKDRPPARALDIGTGSGCVGVTLAVRNPTVEIVAVDLSTAALQIAGQNAEKHKVAARLEFQSADLFPTSGRFDLIVSNPPYIATKEVETLAPEVRDHEPRLALDGGDDGLTIIRRLIVTAPQSLNAGGALMLEISPEQADAVTTLFSADPHWKNIRRIPDMSRQTRVLAAEWD